MIRKEAIVAILGSPVAYYAAFAKVLGGVEAGVFASQFFYWYGKGHNPEGWVYKTQSEIEDETGLTRRNQETARKKLRKLGVLEERYAGMPAKLYYRLNLDILFPLMNEWFSVEVLGDHSEADDEDDGDLSTGVNAQDGAFRHPRMLDPAKQGSANAPSKDVQTRHPSMSESAKQESANPPIMHGASRRANTKNTTETTAENTTQTTTETAADASTVDEVDASVSVSVIVSVEDVPQWVLDEFAYFLGDGRSINQADYAALKELAAYPEHVILQSFDAAQVKLTGPHLEPIRSLGRWLVGTARRKVEEETKYGSTVAYAPQEFDYDEADGSGAGGGLRYEEEQVELPAPLSAEELFWKSVLTELSLRVPRDTYDNWVRDMRLLANNDDEYVIGLPNARSKDWVENRFANTLRQTLSSRIGRPAAVRFELPSE